MASGNRAAAFNLRRRRSGRRYFFPFFPFPRAKWKEKLAQLVNRFCYETLSKVFHYNSKLLFNEYSTHYGKQTLLTKNYGSVNLILLITFFERPLNIFNWIFWNFELKSVGSKETSDAINQQWINFSLAGLLVFRQLNIVQRTTLRCLFGLDQLNSLTDIKISFSLVD